MFFFNYLSSKDLLASGSKLRSAASLNTIIKIYILLIIMKIIQDFPTKLENILDLNVFYNSNNGFKKNSGVKK